MEIIATYGTVFLVLAIVFGFYMTWGIGANDVANAMGTSVGSGAINVKQAIIIANPSYLTRLIGDTTGFRA
mgnify:CR=1 FL=1